MPKEFVLQGRFRTENKEGLSVKVFLLDLWTALLNVKRSSLDPHPGYFLF